MRDLINEILRLFKEQYNYDKDDTCSESLAKKMNKESYLKLESIDQVVQETPQITSSVNLEEMYLYRESPNYRVFKPNDLSDSEKRETNASNSSDIEMTVIESSSDEEFRKPHKKVRYYEPPTVLRVQMNPNKKRKHKKKKK